jgi:hypothetical protein
LAPYWKLIAGRRGYVSLKTPSILGSENAYNNGNAELFSLFS